MTLYTRLRETALKLLTAYGYDVVLVTRSNGVFSHELGVVTVQESTSNGKAVVFPRNGKSGDGAVVKDAQVMYLSAGVKPSPSDIVRPATGTQPTYRVVSPVAVISPSGTDVLYELNVVEA